MSRPAAALLFGLCLVMTSCAATELSPDMRQLCAKADQERFHPAAQHATSNDVLLATIATTADPLQLKRALQGVDPNLPRGTTGITPLAAAAGLGNWRAAQMLLALGADIDRPSSKGATAFEYAVQNAQLPTAWRLLQRGAAVPPPSAPHADVLLPSAALAENGIDAAAFIAFLGELGYSVDARLMGDTALLIAAELGHRELVELLLARGADATLRNARGETPQLVAQRAGHPQIVQLLDEPGNASAISTRTAPRVRPLP